MMRMKKNLLALVILASASQAMAVDGVNVKVTGTIAPPACTPTLSGGGTVDYGNIDTSTLSATDYTQLDTKTIDLTITCLAPTRVAFQAINGRIGSLATGPENASGAGHDVFALKYGTLVGLGMEGNDKIGGYGLVFGTPVADGVAVVNLWQNLGASSWTVSETTNVYGPSEPINVTWGSAATKTPASFITMVVPLEITAFINKTSELDMTKQIKLDGLTTLEMSYL